MNADTVRQKPRIKKENGVWYCNYWRPWDCENYHGEFVSRYNDRVRLALRLCDRLNAKKPH